MRTRIYPLFIISFFISFNLLSQGIEEYENLQKGRTLYEKRLYLSAKTTLMLALNQAKQDNFYDEDRIIEIENYILRCDIHLEPINATKQIDRWLNKYKNNPLAEKLISEIAKDIINAGESKVVVELLKNKTNLTESNTFYLAFAYFQLKDYEKSEEYFLPISKSKDADISKPALFYLGYIYYANKKYLKATEVYQELENKPLIINPKVIFPDQNIAINKQYANFWIKSLYELNNSIPYQSVIQLAERKSIFQDKSQSVFDRNTQKFIARLYFNVGKHTEVDMIYRNLDLDSQIDSTDKFYHILSQIEIAGDEKSKLVLITSALMDLTDLNSAPFRQKVFLTLANVYIKLQEFQLADQNLDKLIEVNSDTLVNRQALLTKIKLKTKSNNVNLAYRDVEKYMTNYPNNLNEKAFYDTFYELLARENSLAYSIKNIEFIPNNNAVLKRIFQKYARAYFLTEINKGQKEIKSVKELFDLANKYSNDKSDEVDLHIDYLKVILQETIKYSKLFDAATKSLNALEENLEKTQKSITSIEKNPEYLKIKKERDLIYKERNRLYNESIQLIIKYFDAPNEDLNNIRPNRFDYLAKIIIECFQKSNNKEFDKQLRIVRMIFNSEYATENTRMLASVCFQDMVKNNEKYWDDYQELQKNPKLTINERDTYTYQGIKIKDVIINKENCDQLELIYKLINNYLENYSIYKEDVKTILQILEENDVCLSSLELRIKELSKKINTLVKATSDSPELLELVTKRAELLEKVGIQESKKISKSGNSNPQYINIKQDALFVINNSKNRVSVDSTANKLIKLARDNGDELFIVSQLSNFESKDQVWSDCINLRKSGKLKEAIEALELFKENFKERNPQYNPSYILGEINIELKDSSAAYYHYADVISNWNVYAKDSTVLRRVTYFLPKTGIATKKYKELVKLYYGIPTAYLPKEFRNSTYTNYFISQARNMGSNEAEKYFLEEFSNQANLDNQTAQNKRNTIEKFERLIKLYGNKVENVEEGQKLKNILTKTVSYYKANDITNNLKDYQWKLADLSSSNEKIDDFWNILSDIRQKRISPNDSLRFIRKLVEYRDARCRLNDYDNVNLINSELINLGKKINRMNKTKTEKEAGADAVLDYAKTLYFQNKFQELNNFLYDFIYKNEVREGYFQTQIERIYPEAFLLLGLSFEKLNKCSDAKELLANGYSSQLVKKDEIIAEIIRSRSIQLKCNP